VFDIEYWLLEEAKLKRLPPRKALAGRVALITGGTGGTRLRALPRIRGAHLRGAPGRLAAAHRAQDVRAGVLRHRHPGLGLIADGGAIDPIGLYRQSGRRRRVAARAG
jgi:hypothetical protein